MGVIMIFMPESPFYLLMKGKEAEARKSLQWLRGNQYDIEDEFLEMLATRKKQQDIGTISMKEFLSNRVYILPGLIMIVLMFIQQYSGVNAVFFYLTEIFNKADVGLSSGLSATLVSLVQVIGTGFAVLIVERLGRKVLLMTSAVGTCISIVALGAFFYLDENKRCEYIYDNGTTTLEPDFGACDNNSDIDPSTVEDLGWLPLTSLIVYVFTFSVGFGPLPWMMNGEFFSIESKSLVGQYLIFTSYPIMFHQKT